MLSCSCHTWPPTRMCVVPLGTQVSSDQSPGACRFLLQDHAAYEEPSSEHDPMEQPTYDDNTGALCKRIRC